MSQTMCLPPVTDFLDSDSLRIENYFKFRNPSKYPSKTRTSQQSQSLSSIPFRRLSLSCPPRYRILKKWDRNTCACLRGDFNNKETITRDIQCIHTNQFMNSLAPLRCASVLRLAEKELQDSNILSQQGGNDHLVLSERWKKAVTSKLKQAETRIQEQHNLLLAIQRGETYHASSVHNRYNLRHSFYAELPMTDWPSMKRLSTDIATTASWFFDLKTTMDFTLAKKSRALISSQATVLSLLQENNKLRHMVKQILHWTGPDRSQNLTLSNTPVMTESGKGLLCQSLSNCPNTNPPANVNSLSSTYGLPYSLKITPPKIHLNDYLRKQCQQDLSVSTDSNPRYFTASQGGALSYIDHSNNEIKQHPGHVLLNMTEQDDTMIPYKMSQNHINLKPRSIDVNDSVIDVSHLTSNQLLNSIFNTDCFKSPTSIQHNNNNSILQYPITDDLKFRLDSTVSIVKDQANTHVSANNICNDTVLKEQESCIPDITCPIEQQKESLPLNTYFNNTCHLFSPSQCITVATNAIDNNYSHVTEISKLQSSTSIVPQDPINPKTKEEKKYIQPQMLKNQQFQESNLLPDLDHLTFVNRQPIIMGHNNLLSKQEHIHQHVSYVTESLENEQVRKQSPISQAVSAENLKDDVHLFHDIQPLKGPLCDVKETSLLNKEQSASFFQLPPTTRIEKVSTPHMISIAYPKKVSMKQSMHYPSQVVTSSINKFVFNSAKTTRPMNKSSYLLQRHITLLTAPETENVHFGTISEKSLSFCDIPTQRFHFASTI